MSEDKNRKKTGKAHKAGEKYGSKVRTKCLTLLKTGLSVREVSERTGVARSTINAWKKSLTEDARARLDSLGTEKQKEFVNRAWSDIELAQRAGSRKVEMLFRSMETLSKLADVVEADEQLTGEQKLELIDTLKGLSNLKLGELAKWIEVNATQARLMEGKPTANVAVSGIGFEDL